MNRQVANLPPHLAQWIDSLPVPVMLLDRRGRTLCINQAWQEAAVPGGLMAPTDHRGADHLHELETGKGFAYEAARDLAAGLRAVLEGQDHCTVLYEIHDQAWEAVIHQLDDAPVAAALVHIDRAGEATAEAALEDADAWAQRVAQWEAKELDQNRRIQQAMQEMHGPLTPIRLRLHQLRSGLLGKLEPAQLHALEQIAANVEDLWHMQDALLHGLQDDGNGSDLADVMSQLSPGLHERALRAGVRLELDGEGAGRIHDPLRPLISLLAHQAIQGTPAGGHVRVEIAGDAAPSMTLHQESPAQDTPALRLARRLLEEHGGQLQIDGDRRGAKIRLQFPEFHRK
ncbi:MAG: hypothetical protein ACPHID_03965 [Thermoplasmatota archaeon]